MKRWLSLRVLGVVLTAALLGGCSIGSPPGETTALPVGASLAAAPNDPCPRGYLRLTLVPETVEEAALVDRTIACGDPSGRSVYLDNRSSSVWVVDEPAGIRRTDPGEPSAQVALYRHFSAASVYGITLEPATRMYVSLAPGDRLHMRLDAQAQAMWHVGETLKNRIVTGGRDALIRATTRGSSTNRALATCFAQGYDFGAGLGTITTADGAALTEYLGLGKAARTCSHAVRTAQQDAVATGTPTLVSVDDAVRVARTPSFTSQVTTNLRVSLSRLAAFLAR